MKRLFLAVGLVALVGCATGYRPRQPPMGRGYWERGLAPGVYQVYYWGRGVRIEQVQAYVARRGRELCARDGFPHARVDVAAKFRTYKNEGVKAVCMTEEEFANQQATERERLNAERARQLPAPIF